VNVLFGVSAKLRIINDRRFREDAERFQKIVVPTRRAAISIEASARRETSPPGVPPIPTGTPSR
jgi:hypothetical protein